MIVLDTNVLSELMRPIPARRVEQWLADQADESVFISAITEAELLYGVALLPLGRRRSMLTVVVEQILRDDFRSRVLPFDSAAAGAYADIAAASRRGGWPMPRSPGS